MRHISCHVTAILLALAALAASGCEKATILPANAGATGDVSVPAVRYDFTAVGTPAYTAQKVAETRGALLYSAHCNACHTSEIHWRDRRLAADIGSLESQVRRWRSSIRLYWTEEEVADVVRYLNAVYYGFEDGGQKGQQEGKKPLQTLHIN